jgi:hypothetical protein
MDTCGRRSEGFQTGTTVAQKASIGQMANLSRDSGMRKGRTEKNREGCGILSEFRPPAMNKVFHYRLMKSFKNHSI